MSYDGLPLALPISVRSAFANVEATGLTITSRCTNRNNHTAWNTLSTCKARIIEFLWSSTVISGVKLCAMKFVQRVIVVQTRGISDPRVVVCSPSLYKVMCIPEIFCQILAASEQKRSQPCILPGRPPIHTSCKAGE